MAEPENISAPQQVSGIDRASLLRAIPSLPLEIQDHIYCETLMSWSDEELDRTYFSKVKDDLYDDSRYSKAERNETFKLESVSMQRFAKLREDLLNATRNNPQVLEQPFRCLTIRALTKYDRRDAAVDAVSVQTMSRHVLPPWAINGGVPRTHRMLRQWEYQHLTSYDQLGDLIGQSLLPVYEFLTGQAGALLKQLGFVEEYYDVDFELVVYAKSHLCSEGSSFSYTFAVAERRYKSAEQYFNVLEDRIEDFRYCGVGLQVFRR